MTVACVNIIRNFSPFVCLQDVFHCICKEKITEMSFLRVSDLLLISVVINHDVGSLLLHKNIMFSFKIIDKFLLEKCVCSSSNRCNRCNHSPGNGCSITQVKTCLHEYKTWYFLAGTFFGGARMRLIRF